MSPDLTTLGVLRSWFDLHEDPGWVMEALGLFMHRRLERAGYWCTPRNSATFASTRRRRRSRLVGRPRRGVAESSPVVMTVPMARAPNWIVGEDLRDFLSLGIVTGYFSLEELAYRPDWPDHIESADEDARSDELTDLATALGLDPWRDVASRLELLRQRVGPTLIVDDPPGRVDR